jgi:hypothetical protein
VHLIVRLYGRFEEIPAFARLEQSADVTDSVSKVVEGASGGGAQECLQLWECHFDRVQVGGVLGHDFKCLVGIAGEIGANNAWSDGARILALSPF